MTCSERLLGTHNQFVRFFYLVVKSKSVQQRNSAICLLLASINLSIPVSTCTAMCYRFGAHLACESSPLFIPYARSN